jgi:5-(carboxyamino)imidazole ribonucleotide synthase
MKVGVLGAGQLGRMLALAGIPLGVQFSFYSEAQNTCVTGLGSQLCGSFSDKASLDSFAAEVDVITVESENIPVSTLKHLAQHKPVHPNPRAIEIIQDRLTEKQLFQELGIPTAEFHPVGSGENLRDIASRLPAELIIKLRRFGYDGRGQATLSNTDDAHAIWEQMGAAPMIAEEKLDFSREVSIISVRNALGETRFYPLVENLHQNGILIRSHVCPADALQNKAEEYASRVIDHLDYVGVLAIEFFDCDGSLVANEIAPRVHNSGHWSIEGSVTSQFENHVRAILNWPLGDTAAQENVTMYNIIGGMPENTDILGISNAHLHNYGKTPRPGRKLGHITLCNPAKEQVERVEAELGLDIRNR